jgi:hypothetical protein
MQSPPCSTNHDLNTSPESKLLKVSAAGQGIGWLRDNLNNPLPPFPELSALAISANPITHITPNDPPLFPAHGDLDTVVPLRQSVRLRDAALAQGIPVFLAIATGFAHGSVGAEISNQTAAWMRDLLAGELACAIDLYGDGQIDIEDLYRANEQPVDINGDGTIDGQDTACLERHLRRNENADISAPPR